MNSRQIVMLGTHPATRGGVAAVVNVYRAAGLFEQRRILYIPTHRDGARWEKLLIMVQGWFRFMGLLLSGKVALVHVHVSFRASFWRKLFFIVPATLVGRPLLLHLHSGGFSRFYEEECGMVGKLAVQWAFGRASKVVVLSRGWGDWVRTVCAEQEPRVLHNPVVLPAAGNLAQRRGGPGHILFLGRMSATKGIFDLLAAVAKVRASGIEATLSVCGDGDAEAVRAAAAQLGIAQAVQLVGWVEGRAKEIEFSRATVFCLPSYHEGMPMSILEAMSAGLPVVSTRVGGIPEVITDGKEGLLVQSGDIDGLSDKLREIMTNPRLADQMGSAGRQKVMRCFAATVIVSQLTSLYDEILEGVPQ
jgi:glycosyltransferase involved in cell wall biosynthesis